MVRKTRKMAEGAAETESAPRKRRAYLPAAERRKLIIAAAQQVFVESNLTGSRTRDIARVAQVNQATLFEHFESKEALFKEAVVQPLIDTMKGMNARVIEYSGAGSSEEFVRLAKGSAHHHLQEMVAIFPLLTTALFSDPETGRELYREHIAPLLKVRSEAVAPLIKDCLDPEFVSLANFGIMFAVAMERWLGGRERDLVETGEQFSRFSTTGSARS